MTGDQPIKDADAIASTRYSMGQRFCSIPVIGRSP